MANGAIAISDSIEQTLRDRDEQRRFALESRSELMRTQLGHDVVGFAEFSAAYPPKKGPSNLMIGIAGAGMGIVGFGAIAAVASFLITGGVSGAILLGAVVAGGILGAALGLPPTNYDPAQAEQLNRYESYLNQAAAEPARAPAIAHDHGINYRDDHAARLIERTSVQPSQALG